MTANETEAWYEVRDGQYFCKNCNQLLIGQTVKEAFVLNAPTEGASYHCGRCNRSVILMASPR